MFYTALLAILVQANAANSFESRWDFLQTQDAVVVGRDQLSRSLEQLIADFPENEQRAEVMIRLSALYEGLDSSTGLTNEPEIAIHWSREAVNAATPYSSLWAKAVSRLAARIFDSSPAEAERLLTDAYKNCDEPVLRAMAVHDLQMLALWQGDLERAEQLCRQLHTWWGKPGNGTRDPASRARIDGYIRSSASSMLASWSSTHTPSSKAAKERFLNDMWQPHVQMANDSLESFRNSVIPDDGESQRIEVNTRSTWVVVLILVNLVMVIGLGAYLFVKLRWSPRT